LAHLEEKYNKMSDKDQLKKEIMLMTKRVLQRTHHLRPLNVFLKYRTGKIQNITVSDLEWSGDQIFDTEEEIFESGTFLAGRPLVKYDLATEVMEVYQNDELAHEVNFKEDDN